MQNFLLTVLLTILCSMGYASCNSSIAPTAPSSRYQLLNNDTEVKDLKTNLIWQRCSVGQTWSGSSCAGAASKYTWQNALQLGQSMTADWRLPNIKELQSLVEKACSRPSINQTIFPNTSSDNYWSSSYNRSYWSVSFAAGLISSSGGGYNYVRLVRVGQ